MKFFARICLLAAVVALAINIPTVGGLSAVNDTQVASYNLPVVMYHGILKSRTGTYVTSPAQLEADFKAIADMGYTPVFLSEVAAFVDGNGTLPQKPVVITFDDGLYNNLYYALPLAKKYNFKIVVNVVTSFCAYATNTEGEANNANYSYLTLPQLKELTDSGLVEIGNHTHAMHKFRPRYGIDRKNGEDDIAYAAALRADFEKAQNLIAATGAPKPVTFAYPFGKYTDIGRETLKDMGFRVMLTCNEGVSVVRQGEPDSLYALKRYNRSGNITTQEFVKKVFGKLENEGKEFK